MTTDPTDLVAALEAAEALDFRDDCPECEGNGEPEGCSLCFPKADDARLKRRAALALAKGGFGGLCLVPLEPTPEMRIAGGIAWSEAEAEAETYVDTADACYKAMITAYRAQPRSDRAVTADDLLEWFRARPGASWVATIADIERAVAEIRGEPIPTYPPEAGK